MVLGYGSGFSLKPQNNKLLRMDGVSYRGVFQLFINPVKTQIIVHQSHIHISEPTRPLYISYAVFTPHNTTQTYALQLVPVYINNLTHTHAPPARSWDRAFLEFIIGGAAPTPSTIQPKLSLS